MRPRGVFVDGAIDYLSSMTRASGDDASRGGSQLGPFVPHGDRCTRTFNTANDVVRVAGPTPRGCRWRPSTWRCSISAPATSARRLARARRWRTRVERGPIAAAPGVDEVSAVRPGARGKLRTRLLPVGGPLRRPRNLDRLARVQLRVGSAQQAQARHPDLHRLVLDHREPANPQWDRALDQSLTTEARCCTRLATRCEIVRVARLHRRRAPSLRACAHGGRAIMGTVAPRRPAERGC